MSEAIGVGGAQASEVPPRSPRQTRMGPAPFASFEDLSDEVRPKGDSPDEKPVIRLPDINEDDSVSETRSEKAEAEPQPANAMENLGPNATTPQGLGNLQTPSTPRIDISRASSSSHHDSRDSSPENAIFGIGSDTHDAEGAKLGLGFREDGTADLRSSTEELAFLEPNAANAEKESSKQPSRRSPLMFKPQEDHHRKDSQCSDIVLLSISGRTSRLSSIGSQGSAHSNVSGISNMSHISGHSIVSHISDRSRLSVISGVSRSPSPHKMLLETSFCGPKPLENDVGVVGNDKHHSEVLEQVLLSRKHDPKDAILAEGILVAKSKEVKPAANPRNSVTEKQIIKPQTESKPAVKQEVQETKQSTTVSTLGSAYKNEIKKSNPIPEAKPKQAAKKGINLPQRQTRREGEADYIRIKLKPDHMYDDDGQSQQEAMQKPASLNLTDHSKKNAQHFSQIVKHEEKEEEKAAIIIEKPVIHSQQTPGTSPKQSKQILKDGSRTPSPVGRTPSRKSSFCSLFKSRETIASPESPTGSASRRKGSAKEPSTHGSRSRSKSREREPVTPTTSNKSKGSVLAIFKPNRKSSASASPVARETLPNLDAITIDNKYTSEPRVVKKQPAKEKLRYYETPVDGFIRIPLHTPSDEEEKTIIKEKKVEVVAPPIKAAKPIVREDPLNEIKVDRPFSAPSSSRPSFSHSTASSRRSEIKQEVLSDGIIRIPLHSPSEDRLVRCDLLSEQEIEETKRLCSNITTKKSSISEKASNGSISSSAEASKTEEVKVKIEAPPKHVEAAPEPVMSSSPEATVEPEVEKPACEEKMSSQSKRHIIFATKVGSKEQIFSMQFSLSKTDSQCSQMSESRSQISEDSVIEVPIADSCEKVEKSMQDTIVEKVDKMVETVDIAELKETIVTMKETCVQTSRLEKDLSCDDPTINPSKERASTKRPTLSPRNSVLSEDLHDSSESERDSELDFIRRKQLQVLEKSGRCPEGHSIDLERKELVRQESSFDEELPYVPTTLPMERSVAVPIVPIKQRQTIEVKMFPIERPRSTTPINPSCLEEYCSDEVYTPDGAKPERLKICLPQGETPDRPKAKQKAKSPRRVSTASSPKTWFEFAEQGISKPGTRKSSMGHESDSDPAPPLPPRAPVPKSQWINFENIPERRKVPKRIQTIPNRNNVESNNEGNVIYKYVNPEDCKCECHESGRDTTTEDATPDKEEDEEPLLDETAEVEGLSLPPAERLVKKNINVLRETKIGETTVEFSYSHRPVASQATRVVRNFSTETNTSSNRSSVTSQDADRSSSSGSPNDVFPSRRPARSP